MPDLPVLELHHDPAPRPRKKGPSAYDLAKIAFFFFGFPKNAFGSIDVTNRCNLRCRHCYYYAPPEEELPDELAADAWVARLEALRRQNPFWEFPFFNCSWVGGDPLIRKGIIERCKKFFRYNTVVTNGTIPLPDWPDVNWYVSIDGDEELHEQIRDPQRHFRRNGGAGIHARIKNNLERSKHLGITITYCINRENVRCIEKVVKEWYEAGAKHVTFDFFTPVEGLDDGLWLDFAERDRVIDKLIALRRVYGDFFVLPERAFRLMRSATARDVTDNCLLRTKSFALDAAGQPKGKCVMGDTADCDRCGCVVPFYLRSLTDRTLILRDLGASAVNGGQRLLAQIGLTDPTAAAGGGDGGATAR
ncbi:MAG TPA: radical SAM protein [Myxococcota bacterium]|nr:radical SAM protein [Myxococcota bacterium]